MTTNEAEAPEKPPGRRHANVEAAKLAVMEDVAYIQKRIDVAVGGGGKYKAAGAEDFISAIRPAMVEHGLTITPVHVEQIHRDRYSSKNGSDWDRVTLRVRYRISHAASGTCEEGEAFGEGACNSDKAVQKGMTSALKYFFRQEFMLETGEDDPDRVRVEAVDKEKRKAYQEERFAAARKHLRSMFKGRRPTDAETRSFFNGLIVCLEKEQLTRRMVKDLRLELERRQSAATVEVTPPQVVAPVQAIPERKVEPPPVAEQTMPAPTIGPAAAPAEPPLEATPAPVGMPAYPPGTDAAPAEPAGLDRRGPPLNPATPPQVFDPETFDPDNKPEQIGPVAAAVQHLKGKAWVDAARAVLETCNLDECEELAGLAEWASTNFLLDGPELGEVRRMIAAFRAGRRPSQDAPRKTDPVPSAPPQPAKPTGKKAGPTSDRDVEAAFQEELEAASGEASFERFQGLLTRTRNFAQASPKRRELSRRLLVNLGAELQRVMKAGKVENESFAALVTAVTSAIKTA